MRKILREHTKKTQGFSLAEVLMTVAILLILLALIVPAVFVLQKNLRQKELDSKAETIYMAVQERLTDLYSSGAIDTYNPATHTDITSVGTVPGDYDENVQSVVLDSDSVYALVSGRNSTNAIVNDEVLDSALKNGHFVVEYIPYVKSLEGNRQLTAATVYAVYYSEDREDVSASYYDGNTISDRYNRALRDKSGRLKDGAKVGYYGGSNANSGSSTNSLDIVSAVITSNEEVNKAVIKVRKPITLNDNQITYTFTLEDDYGHNRVITYANGGYYVGDKLINGSAFKKPGTAGVSRTFEITLDDLSSDETRFVNLFGEHSKLGAAGNNLVTGSNITLRVSAKSNDHTVSASDTVTVRGNSIFAYDEKNPVNDGTAYITTGRHLQNLDESSGVNSTSAVTRSRKAITKAKIQKDISFGTDSKFYEAYKDSYFKEADKDGGPRVSVVTVKKINTDGSVTNVVVPLFKSITNSVLTEVSGDYEDNGTTKNAVISKLITNNGLFQTVNTVNQDITLKNFSLVGERTLNGANAGGVIGQVTGGNVTGGNVTLENIAVYLSTTQQDIPSAITQEMHIENNGWINGNIAGGLVGVNDGNLTILNSFSSSVLKGKTIAGGLVGKNTGSLTVTTSYSDSYIFAPTGAGLVGDTSGTVTMESVYAAGFLAVSDYGTGAGLVNGTVSSLTNAYTLVKPCTSDDSGIVDKEPEGYTYYATVSSGSVSNVYYVRSSVNTNANIGDAVNAKNLKDKALGTQFQQTTLADHPYKLMGQSLTSYNYPKLNGLAHYGDWDAEFEEGSLVYYEQYSDGTNTYYGFDGANVHVSLVSKDTITGDGYGIVYEDNEANIPDSITVNVGGADKTINKGDDYYSINKGDDYYSVEANGKKYRIYPLFKDVLNTVSDTSSFYTRVSISAKGETKYYDYNPLFAQSVVSVSDSNAQSALPEQVNIRSPRHLYNLSRVYVKDSVYKKNDSIVYAQLRNIDYAAYNWDDFTLTSSVSMQKPTGSDSTVSFSAVYDGGTNTIGNISFVSDGDYIGMFGYVEGTVRNVVLATQYREGQPSCYVQRNKTIDKNETVYAGILAGYNAGTIQNSAVAGYYLSDTNTIKGYANSKVYLGGFVGYNAEKGVISNCSADSPKMSVDMFQAECYAGGFTGYNEGSITNAYALTHITSSANSGKTIIAGFTAHNTGSISDTYCATALTSSGVGSVSYAYSPIGGSIKNSRYLTKGTYYLGYEVNSYDRNEANSAGTPSSFADLQKGSKATSSLYHAKTTKLDDAQSNYPFTAYVKKADGSYVHYGEWHVKPSLGKMGVFYWEKETSGNNNGYKISYIGIDVALQQVEQESTLCTAHDDGGVIEEYGYGYYTSEDLENVSVNYDSLKVGEVVNEEAQRSLQQQLSGFRFYPYTTRTDGNDSICLEGTGTNGKITLTQTDTHGRTYSYTFTISPFFGNALSLDDARGANVSDKASAYTSKTVGWSALPYQIRSAQQLQYINWNYLSRSCTEQVYGNNYQNFNYLMYTTINGAGIQTKGSAGRNENANIVFKQSHDLNAETISNFQPVAGQGTSSTYTAYSATLYAWFGGTYDGQSYKIQDLNITSDSFTVGLFGTTVDADIRNTILYSTNSADPAKIERLDENTNPDYETGHIGGYAVGGLIGIAYNYENTTGNLIQNCAIAGYKIVDNSKNVMGLGEANVGGLIGVSNVNIDQCSAVADIEINSKALPAFWGSFIRVGGISGGVQDSVTNCYSGGKITVDKSNENATLYDTYEARGIGKYSQYYGNAQYDQFVERTNKVSVSSNVRVSTNRTSTNIYIAGIAGSGFTMNYQNFTGGYKDTKDGEPYVENCYTYMEFPKLEGTIRSITTIASVADRFESVKLKGIENCAYLEGITQNLTQSAIAESAPKYYFSSKSSGKWTESDIQNMVLGNSKTIANYFGKDGKGNMVSESQNTSVSYAQMSNLSITDSSSFLNKMNGGKTTDTSKFHAVTSTESTSSGEQPINGKYSFNAGDSTLEGRNYPFPTVITQPTKENKTVNVHYGTWPNHDPYWSNGMDTLDIFSELNTAGEALKTFTLNSNGKTFSLDSNDITFDTEGIVAVQGIMKVNDAYQVTLKALKTGTVTVTAHMKMNGQDAEAHFTLSVTANLTVTANPSEMILASKLKEYYPMTQDVTLSMYPTADTTKVIDAKDITWSVTSSHDILEPDVGVSEVTGNQVTITGFGVNGKVSIKGTVTYNGIPYSATTMIVVDRPAAVALSDSSSYCEAGIVNDGSAEITGTLVTDYDDHTKPENTSSRYFIYAANDKEILDENIQVTATSGEAKLDVYVDKSNVTTSSNGFTSIPVYITYRNSDLNTALEDVRIQAVITKDGKTYTLALENVTVKPTPYAVRLHGNGGIFTNLDNVDDSNKQDEIKTVELRNDINLNSEEYTLKRTGYTFNGWCTDVNVPDNKKDSVTVAEMQADLNLYALWTPMKSKVEVTVGETKSYVDIAYDLSNLSLDSKPGKGMYCTGWYQEDKQILDGDGKVIDQTAWNKAILNASSEDDVVYTLTPGYAQYKKVTLNLDGGAYGGTSDSFIVYSKGGSVDLSEYTPVKAGYTFIGWYTDVKDETTKVEEVVDAATYDGKTLYAKYTIGIIDFKVKKTDGSEDSAGKTVYFTEVPETVNVEDIPEKYKKLENNYLLEGWYAGDTKVLDYDGKVVDKEIFTADHTETYNLYARWVKVTFVIMPDNSFKDGESYFFTNVDARNANTNGRGVYGVSADQNEDNVSLNGTSVNAGIYGNEFTSMDVLHSVEWKFTANANSSTTGQLSNNGKYLHGELDNNVYSLSVQDTESDNPWQFTKAGGPHRILNSSCYLGRKGAENDTTESIRSVFVATNNDGSVWVFKLKKDPKTTAG